MKSDLDRLMEDRGMNALLVFGNTKNNPPMTYLTGGGHVTGATLVKKLGEEAVIFCNVMERDEAAKSGLIVRLYDEFPWQDLLKEADSEVSLLPALRLKHILDVLSVVGKVGIYGHVELSEMYAMLGQAQKWMPSVEFIGEQPENSLFLCAMETKDADEVTRIRRMGRITTEVVRMTSNYLTSRSVDPDEVLLEDGCVPLKLGTVKDKINLWLAERGATPSEGFIFAIGRDAGVPHSQGNPEDLIRLGQTLVFDIYPQEPGGGYFYDFTRTWSLGYARPEAQALYDHVRHCYHKLIENLDLNTPFRSSQEMACEIFEDQGHATVRTVKGPQEGYIHSVGHGVGLNIHERPWSGLTAGNDNRLKPGTVFTIEPGLYYPSKAMGIRIEDTYWVNSQGEIELLAEYPYDFILEMKNWNPQ